MSTIGRWAKPNDGPWTQRLAHTLPIATTLYVVNGLAQAVPAWDLVTGSRPGRLVLGLIIMWLFGAVVAFVLHSPAACERCLIHVITVNGPEEALRRVRWLRLNHVWTARRAVAFAAVAFAATTILNSLDFRIAAGIALVVTVVVVGAVLRSQRIHAQLQPWCPFCGGGGAVEEPVTPPTPVGTRTTD